MKSHRIAAVAAILLLSACAGSAKDDSAAETPAFVETASTEVRHAAEISNAINYAPTKTDSILTAHNVTPEQLAAMMFRIARDSTASADYGRLTAK